MSKIKNATGYYCARMKGIWTMYFSLNYREVYNNLINGLNGLAQVIALVVLIPLVKLSSPFICFFLTVKVWGKLNSK